MKLSEMLEQQQRPHTIKTIKVKKVRDLLGNSGECFETLTGKKVYIRNNGNWYTCMGNKPLNYNFIVIGEQNDNIKTCNNCNNCFVDLSVNDYGCECENITEQKLQEHFTDDKPNCPYWKETKAN